MIACSGRETAQVDINYQKLETPISKAGCSLFDLSANGPAGTDLEGLLAASTGGSTPRPVNKDAPLAEFEKIATAFPVFRVAAQG